MSSNLKVNSLVPATGTAIGIGTTGGTIDFRCPATFGGNVTIGGTLTYDEVINIDSIGIVTARSGLKVTGGQLDVGSNIKAGNAGVITATTFVGNLTGNPTGSGANLTNLPAGNLTGTVADARISTLTASKLSGALPAISGASLTNLPAQATIANNADNRVITGGSGVNLNGESNFTWTGSALQVTAGTGNQFPFNIRNDFTPNSQRCDYGYFANATSNNALRLGSINSNGGVTIQSTRMNDSAQKHLLLLNPDGGNVAINKTAGISAKLHIGDTGNNAALSQLIKLGNDSSNAGTGAQLNMGAGSGNESTAACIGGFYDGTGTSFIVKTTGTYANQSTVAERLRIDSYGALLVGTTAPIYSSGDMRHEIKKNNNRAYTSPLMTAHSHLLFNNSDTTTGAFCGLGFRAGTGDGSIGYVYTGTANHSDFVINTDSGSNGVERLRIKSQTGEVGIRGRIVSGRNLAREVGTVISYSTQYSGTRSASNVLSGNKNYEYGYDWLTPGGSRVNANLVIDLGAQYNCDRFVIYNQNEYQDSKREVKNFTLEGSNDNSSWTTILDDDCGASGAHEPNPGFSFRMPASYYDDSEGVSYRYWRFTMKTFHGTDNHGGVCELELYQTGTTTSGNQVGSEICTSSVVAGDMTAETLQGIKRLYASKGMNIYTTGATDTWEITEHGITTNGSYQDKSTIRHKRGVMAVSSSYNSGDLFIRVDNLYNLDSNNWWVFGMLILSNEIQGGQGGGHHYVTSLQLMGLAAWNSVSTQNIVGSMSVSVNQSGSNYVELFVNVNDSSRGPCTVICNGGTFDPPRISFH